MALTGAAATEIQQATVDYDLKLELKNGWGSWTEMDTVPGSIKVTRERGRPARLSAQLIDEDFSLRDERSQANPCQLLAEARVTCSLGSETEYLFQGRVHAITPQDYSLSITGYDWLKRLSEASCEVELVPTEVEVVADGSYRQLYELDSTRLPGLFGLQVIGGGGDEGFDEASQSWRRSWAPSNLRVYRDSGGTDEVASKHWRVDWVSGAVQILEDTSGITYYASNLRCYKESAAASATNVDVGQLVEQALTYSGDGGLGLGGGDIDVATIGIDLGRAYYFKGSVADCIADVRKLFGQHLTCQYHSGTAKFTFAAQTQQPSGSEDYTLYDEVSIAQPRDTRDFATRVVAEGWESQPVNLLAESGTSVTDITTGGVEWFGWDGFTPASPTDFATEGPKLYDGDYTLGAGASSLAASEGGGSNRYDSWYNFIKADGGSSRRIDRIRLVMPGSRHPQANSLDRKGEAWLWPGVQLLVSEDDSTYLPVAPALDRVRYKPHTTLDLPADQLLRHSARYFKFVLGAYKHGYANQADPSVGMAEIEIFTSERFEEAVEVQDGDADGYLKYSTSRDLAITAVDISAETVAVAGDHSAYFTAGRYLVIDGSTGNDGVWQVASSSHSGGTTTITLTGNLTDATPDGNVVTDIWPSYHPDILTRTGGDHIEVRRDYGEQYPRSLARDAALQLLAEKVRLFQQVIFRCVVDPRVYPGDTTIVNDAMSGNVGSILVEKAVIGEAQENRPSAEIHGANYLAEPLDNPS